MVKTVAIWTLAAAVAWTLIAIPVALVWLFITKG